MENGNNIEWHANFCTCDDHDLWFITHLRRPVFVAAVGDRAFDHERISPAVPGENVIWIEAKPDRRKSLHLRTEAIKVLREARDEYQRALGKGWHPSFIIGASFNATFHGSHPLPMTGCPPEGVPCVRR